MAGPFSGAGLSNFGGESKYVSGGGDSKAGAGLLALAAAYAAHKMGLVDLNDPDQQKSINEKGLLGHVVQGAIAPSGGVQMPVSPFGGAVSSPIQMPSIQGVPLGPLSSNTPQDNAVTAQGAVLPPLQPVSQSQPSDYTSGNAGMDTQLSSAPTPPPVSISSVDPELIDEGIGNFAALLMG